MNVLVIAPHPDDELLGCGGTLLRKSNEGDNIAWLLMTSISEKYGWKEEFVHRRETEIRRVCDGLGIKNENLFRFNFPTSKLDNEPLDNLIKKISEVIKSYEPNQVFLPYPGDVHSDHRITFEAASACMKWFRHNSIKQVYLYETPSETDFSLDARYMKFTPNSFIDISQTFENKLKLLEIYASEIGDFPFPRSIDSIRSLAMHRGSQAGFRYAEAFQLILNRL